MNKLKKIVSLVSNTVLKIPNEKLTRKKKLIEANKDYLSCEIGQQIAIPMKTTEPKLLDMVE